MRRIDDANPSGPGLPRSSGFRQRLLAAEFAVMYVALPVVGVIVIDVAPRLLVPLLLLWCAAVVVALRLDPTFDRGQLWRGRSFGGELRRVLAVFACLGSAMALGTWLVFPEAFLGFPRQRPVVWLIVLVGYPLLSVYPQELIWRTFMFHRYRGLFRDPRAMVVASGLSFGFGHVVIGHWAAVVLSGIGGLLFAWTYERSRSTLLASVEHGLYGGLVFTLGLGIYFVPRERAEDWRERLSAAPVVEVCPCEAADACGAVCVRG